MPLVSPYYSEHPGWAEQDPARYWEALAAACRALRKQGEAPPEAVAAVALTARRGTVVNLDCRGQPLRPAILWLDQRRSHRYPPVRGTWGLPFRLVGLHSTLAYLQAEADSNWLWANQPDIWDRTAHYLLLSGYLTYRMTGRLVDSVGCQVGYIPFDYRRQVCHVSETSGLGAAMLAAAGAWMSVEECLTVPASDVMRTCSEMEYRGPPAGDSANGTKLFACVVKVT